MDAEDDGTSGDLFDAWRYAAAQSGSVFHHSPRRYAVVLGAPIRPEPSPLMLQCRFPVSESEA